MYRIGFAGLGGVSVVAMKGQEGCVCVLGCVTAECYCCASPISRILAKDQCPAVLFHELDPRLANNFLQQHPRCTAMARQTERVSLSSAPVESPPRPKSAKGERREEQELGYP